MKAWIRQIALGLALGAGALGCSNKDAATAVTQQAVIPDREVIAYIPQDTPYLWMGLEALPKSLAEKASTISKIFGQLYEKGFRDELERQGATAPEIEQILKDLDGFGNISQLPKLGLSPNFNVTVYGLGILPVMRVELQDVEKARAFLKRVEAACAHPWPVKKLGEQEYFVYDKDGVTAAAAFVKNEFVLALVPTAMAEKLLKIAFLQEKPQNGFKDMSAIRALSRDFGLRYSMGYLDNRLLADLLLGRAQGIGAEVTNAIGAKIGWSAECGNEIAKWLSKMPRFVAGISDSISDAKIDYKLGLELDPDTVKELNALTYQGPGMASDGKLLTASLGLDVGKAIDYVDKQLDAFKAESAQCQELQMVRGLLLGAGMDVGLKLIPAPLRELSAISIGLDELDVKKNTLSGYLTVAHKNPGNLQSLLQGFGGPDLGLKPDGQTVDLTGNLPFLDVPILKIQARMTQNALGFSAGEGQDLTKLMDAKNEPGLIFSLGVNMKLQEELKNDLEKLTKAEDEAEQRARMRKLADLKAAYGAEGVEKFFREEFGDEIFEDLKKMEPDLEKVAEDWIRSQKKNNASNESMKALAEHLGMVLWKLKMMPKGMVGEVSLELQ